MNETDFSKPCTKFEPSREDLGAWESRLNDLIDRNDLDSVMRALATIVADYDAHHIDHIQCHVYHKALDWMCSLKERLENANRCLQEICIAECVERMATSDGAPVPGTERAVSVVYNSRTISIEEVERLLKSGRIESDPRVILSWPENVRNVFPDSEPAPLEPDGNGGGTDG